MPTCDDIPAGWKQFRVPPVFDRAAAAAMGAKFFGPVEDPCVWMPPAAFAACLDPQARATIARQKAGCKGCGE